MLGMWVELSSQSSNHDKVGQQTPCGFHVISRLCCSKLVCREEATEVETTLHGNSTHHSQPQAGSSKHEAALHLVLAELVQQSHLLQGAGSLGGFAGCAASGHPVGLQHIGHPVGLQHIARLCLRMEKMQQIMQPV